MERNRAALAALIGALALVLGVLLSLSSPSPAWHAVASVRQHAGASRHEPAITRGTVRTGAQLVVGERDRRIVKHRSADAWPSGDALPPATALPGAIVESVRAATLDLGARSPCCATFERWAEARAPPRSA